MIREKDSDRDFRTDHWDRCLSQPRHEFLNVSDPEDLSERRPEGGIVPEMEVEAARRVSAGCQKMDLFVVLTSNQILPTLRR
jgi:hypothetical protein